MSHSMPRKKAQDIVRSFTGELISAYRRAWENALTHEDMMNWEEKYYYPNLERAKGNYSFPQWAVSELWGVKRLLFRQHQDKLIWTHVWKKDNRRLISQHPDITDHSPTGISEGESYHCYAFELDGRVIWLPFRAEDREAEIASGRLSKDDITRCTKANPDGLQLFVRHKPNGSPMLCKPVEVVH